MSESTGLERRASPRKAGNDFAWVLSARVRPGRDVHLVDLSREGALVEGPLRLLPGALIDLHLLGHDCRRTVRGRVLRCAVCALDVTCGVRYRAAVRFEQALPEPPFAIDGDHGGASSAQSRCADGDAHVGTRGSNFPQAWRRTIEPG